MAAAVSYVRDWGDPDLPSPTRPTFSLARATARRLRRALQWLDGQNERARPNARPARAFSRLYAAEKIPYAIERYPTRRRGSTTCSIRNWQEPSPIVAATIQSPTSPAFPPGTMTHQAQGFTFDDYPNIKRGYAEYARGRR